MPYIKTTTNVPIPTAAEKELKDQFGRAITLIAGKTENWLMLDFNEAEHLYFAGSDAPAAMLEVDIFGTASNKEYDKLTSALCSCVSEKLGISQSRIYVKYTEVEHWGWNGSNF